PKWNCPAFYDDDDDEYTIQYSEYIKNLSNTPDLPTEEPDNSLSMGDEHLDTIPETKSDELIKSSVEDLVPIPTESEGLSDDMCDVPFCDNNHFDAESDLIESLLSQDTLIVYSPKIDSLLEEFAGELAHINPIPPGIHEADFDPEEDIRLSEQFLYDDTSCDDTPFEDIDYVEASPPDSELIESLNDNPTPDCVLKSPSSSPIPVEDIDSFLEETDMSLSYMDNSLPEFKTFSDHTEETMSGSTTSHADISLPEFLSLDEFSNSFIRDPLFPVIDTLLPFSSENEDKVFNPGILASKEEKSPHSLSHRGFKAFQLIYESSMMIYEGGIPILDDCPDYEDSRACGFVHRSLALQSLACLYWESDILDLID
ncbi:hypothetical protein Tco_0784062, partial [Tanacetum coccineum]